MTPAEQANLLLRKAFQDQAILMLLVDDKNISDDAVGFHAQQAAEKLLKALLALHQQDYPRSHDLNVLIALLARIGICLPLELNLLADLSPLANKFSSMRICQAIRNCLGENGLFGSQCCAN